MRLTIVNQFYPPDLSPTAHLVASLAAHRADCGDEVTVITSAARYTAAPAPAPAPGRAETDHSGITVHRTWSPRRPARSLAGRALHYASFLEAAAWRIARVPAQDVVVCLTTPPFVALLGALHKWLHPRCRLVLWNMDCYPEILEATGLVKPGGMVARLCRRLNAALARRIDHVVCLDGAMRAVIEARGSGPAVPPVTVIPNWEAIREAAATRVDPWEGYARLGLQDRFVAVYAGNAGYGHEFSTILDAAALLRDQPVAFLFVGGGRHFESIAGQSRRRGLGNVVMHPYVARETMPAVFAPAGAAIVTLADAAAGLMSPSKLHGAMAAGVPVLYVGPAGTNVDEAIERFGCGASLRHGDAEGAAAFLLQAMESAARRKTLRTAARRAFKEAYSADRALPQFDRVLAGVVGDASAETTPRDDRRAAA